MAVLNSVFSFMSAVQDFTPVMPKAPADLWHRLILDVFGFVTDYGWRIVVFTVLLKLVLSPLDFYQRYKLHKNQKITERLKPTMEKIQKQYGNDKQAFSQKQMELNRKEGYSYFSSCLPMIVSLVVFITLWLSMQTIAKYMTLDEYTTMYNEYTYVYGQIYDKDDPVKGTKEYETAAVKIGQDVVYEMYYNGIDNSYVRTLRDNPEFAPYIPADFSIVYGENANIKKVRKSFLWVKNVWAPDVPWGSNAVLEWDESDATKNSFKTAIGEYEQASTNGLDTKDSSTIVNATMYNKVMGKILSDNSQSKVNGYLILPILVVVMSVLSQLISTMQQKRAGQVNAKGGLATSMKVMMFIMPIMMGAFALQYASIFSVYMAVNSMITLLLNFAFTGGITLIDTRKKNRNYGIASGSPRAYGRKQSPIIHYVKGANPNAGARETAALGTAVDVGNATARSSKAEKRSSATKPISRGGRPDPNELMSMDMSGKSDKKK